MAADDGNGHDDLGGKAWDPFVWLPPPPERRQDDDVVDVPPVPAIVA